MKRTKTGTQANYLAFFIVSILMLLMSSKGSAQTTFSGKWTLKQRASLAGPDYANAAPKALTVSETKDSITIERENIDGNGQKSKTSETVSKDGNPNIITTFSKRQKTITIAYSKSEKTFKESANLSQPTDKNKADYSYSENWSVSDDGKQLIVIKNFESSKNTFDKWSIKAEYEKLE